MSGAPVCTENIPEITPEMIEAGVSALYGFSITEPTEAEMREAVAAVFRAMCNTRKPAPE